MEKSLAVALLCVGGDRGDSGSVFGGVDGDVCMEDRGGRIFGGVADASRGASGSGFGGVDGDIKGMGDVRMEDKDGGILDIGVVDSVGVMGGGDVSSGGVVGGGGGAATKMWEADESVYELARISPPVARNASFIAVRRTAARRASRTCRATCAMASCTRTCCTRSRLTWRPRPHRWRRASRCSARRW